MIAVIGGTGVGSFPLDSAPTTHSIESFWGTAIVQQGTLQGKEVVFLARHGVGHQIAPHRINYRANIAALVQLGVRAVLATTAVGGLRADLRPGDLLLLDDLIDFTRDRTGKTFFDGENGLVVHCDMTFPYSDVLRTVLLRMAAENQIALRDGGTYLCNDGPRYETAAEVRLFASWGADVAGMTGVPEATLAREADLHYASVSVVTNPGAGISAGPLTHAEVEAEFRNALPRLITLFSETIRHLETDCLPQIGPGIRIPL